MLNKVLKGCEKWFLDVKANVNKAIRNKITGVAVSGQGWEFLLDRQNPLSIKCDKSYLPMAPLALDILYFRNLFFFFDPALSACWW